MLAITGHTSRSVLEGHFTIRMVPRGDAMAGVRLASKPAPHARATFDDCKLLILVVSAVGIEPTT
jgi:hypothetical protein